MAAGETVVGAPPPYGVIIIAGIMGPAAVPNGDTS